MCSGPREIDLPALVFENVCAYITTTYPLVTHLDNNEIVYTGGRQGMCVGSVLASCARWLAMMTKFPGETCRERE